MLDFLNQRKPTRGSVAILDLKLHQNVLAHRARQNVFNIPLLDFEIGGGVLGAVDHRGNRAARPHFADGIAPGGSAGAGGEFNLIGHGFYFLGFLISKSELTDSSSWIRRM